jgi:selenocysteine-specific elongation factor
VVATAGHVDHGKSALVRALTGMEPDRYTEERRRGMTIDLGFVWTTLDPSSVGAAVPSVPTSDPLSGPVSVAFVDVPGHERFVSTMLAGVGPVPVVLLVVAADEGWMPQSQEHLDAVRALGVHHGVVAVSRCDLSDPAPVADDVRRRLADTRLAGCPVVPVSAVDGTGLEQLRAELLGVLAAVPPADPAADVRLWVDRSFSVVGAGMVVTGTLATGSLRLGDELDLHGRSGVHRVAVRGLQSLGATRQAMTGVARVAVNLRGLTSADVRRGDALVTPGTVTSSSLVDVRLQRLDDSTTVAAAGPARLPSQCLVHLGSVQVTAHLRPLGGAHARLRLRSSLPLRLGDRLLLREPGQHTVLGAATVLDVVPPSLNRRGDARRRAEALRSWPDVPDVGDELRRRRVTSPSELRALGFTASAVGSVDAVRAGGWLLDPDATTALQDRLRDAVVDRSGQQVRQPGLTLEEARQLLDLPDARIVPLLLRQPEPGSACAEGDRDEILVAGGRVLLATGAGEEALPGDIAAALSTLRTDLRDRPFQAPDAGRLAELGLDRRALAAAARLGLLERVASDIHLLPDWRAAAVSALASIGEPFTVSQARRALDTTRRVAVPLLERLDAEAVTRRLPDDRRVLRDG